MPESDVGTSLVVGLRSGHARTTRSWLLSRLLRDVTDDIDKQLKTEQPHTPPSQTSAPLKPGQKAWEALRVSIYDVEPLPKPAIDLVWLSGPITITLQLIVAMIPWILYEDWSAFVITGCGTCLALIAASLPQWRAEKYAAPRTGGDTITLTEGNGSRHAIVIRSSPGNGYDLEILARSTRVVRSSLYTRVTVAILAVLWIALLVSVAGLKLHTWCKSRLSVYFSLADLPRYRPARRRSPWERSKCPRCSEKEIPSRAWNWTEACRYYRQ